METLIVACKHPIKTVINFNKLIKMYKIEMHPTLCRILASFYLCGYWQNEKKVSLVRTVGRKLFYTFTMVIFQIVIVICAWISDDNSESLFLVQVEIFAIVMTVKWIYLIRHKDTILFFVSDAIVSHNISDYAVFVEVKKRLNKFMKFVHVYLTTLALVVFVLIISPLPMFSSNKQLPMFINYSIICDYSELIYWMIYSSLALQIFLIFVINLLTVIIWYVLLNCSIKYQVFGNQLARLGVPQITVIDENQLPIWDSFDQEFIDMVETHQRIFEYLPTKKNIGDKWWS